MVTSPTSAMLAATTDDAGRRVRSPSSPTWAANPGAAIPEPSPYYPSSRRMHSPLYLRVEEVSGRRCAGHRARAPRRGGTRAERRAADRPRRGRRAEAGAPCAPSGRRPIGPGCRRRFVPRSARRCAAGPHSRSCPRSSVRAGGHGRRDYRDPAAGAVARFAAGHAARVGVPRVAAMADRPSARPRQRSDAGRHRPPDRRRSSGLRRVGLAAAARRRSDDRRAAGPVQRERPGLGAARLRAAPGCVPTDYRAFVETVRAGLRHAGGLRIDHVLGLFRMWWVPSGADPRDGAYVRYPVDELLAILAIESARAGADHRRRGPRHRAARRPLTARARQRPVHPPPLLRAPPTGGVPAAGARLDHDPRPADPGRRVERLGPGRPGGRRPDARTSPGSRCCGAAWLPPEALPETAELATVALAAHRALAQSPAALVAATLEDAMQVERRPNMPGTVAPARDNWSTALPRRHRVAARRPLRGAPGRGAAPLRLRQGRRITTLSGGRVSLRRAGLAMPRDLDRLHAAEVAHVRAAVDLRVGVQDLAPAAAARQPDAVARAAAAG